MPPLTLEGETLGQKHQHLNRLVEDAITNSKYTQLKDVNYDDGDIENLIKIDIAVKNKNVDYVLEVLKCEDMLYVSRALKRCTWLVTEPQHAHIINPEYLHRHLFPHMTTKAINKLLLSIKLNLKDEKRVEQFYEYVKEHKADESLKWLQNCSLDFVENTLKSGTRIPLYLYERLCKRSFNFLKYYNNVTGSSDSRTLGTVTFLINHHTKEYLDFLDTLHNYAIPNIGEKHTETIMKNYPDRIWNNFEKYASSINLAVVAKYIKKEEIKDFILKHIKNNAIKYLFTNQETLKHFLKYMPQAEKHEFVRKIFLEKTETQDQELDDDTVMMCCAAPCDVSSANSYCWYQYVPFNVAFSELKKLIRAESMPSERCAMLAVLVKTARRNPHHLHTVLQFYQDKHRNEPFKFKIQFIHNVLEQVAVHELDDKTWNILDELFRSAEVYTESNKNIQTCVKSIILYKVVNNQKVPQIIENNFQFETFKSVQTKLSQKHKDSLYAYLFNYISTKLQNKEINDESDFNKYKYLLKQALQLVKDWNKDLNGQDGLLTMVRELILLKKEKSWKTNLLSLYNMNKRWRRLMFEESLLLSACEETCLNALKHSPPLLARHRDELRALRSSDSATPRRLLAKLRLYWPDTIANEWIDEYLQRFNESTGHKALISGLFVLFPQNRALEIAKKYVPVETKINWSEIDQTELSIRKNIAKQLHITRPQPPLDAVLWYAKDDYLQYAVPSLSAVMYNMSKTRGRQHIPKLLDSPVSLQKFAIGMAFDKIDAEELRSMFLNVWKTTKNLTIRAMLFTCTHKMLCKVKNAADAKDIWLVLAIFIDNLSNEENKQIYYKLSKVEDIHISVRGEYFMKSYKMLNSLLVKNNCKSEISTLLSYAPKIMDILDSDFVADHLLASADEEFCTKKCRIGEVIAAYSLHGRTTDEQLKRFDKVLGPIMDRALPSWNVVINEEYLIKYNFNNLTNDIASQFRENVIRKINHVPVELFSAITNKIDEKLPTQEKYIISTFWKLIRDYAKLIYEHNSLLGDDEMSASDYQNPDSMGKIEKIWREVNSKILPKLGEKFLEHLKEDVIRYYPSIYSVFGEALDTFCRSVLYYDTYMALVIWKHMLGDKECTPSYILVCERIPQYINNDEERNERAEIYEILGSHTSEEVQMHLLKAIRDIPNIDKKTRQS